MKHSLYFHVIVLESVKLIESGPSCLLGVSGIGIRDANLKSDLHSRTRYIVLAGRTTVKVFSVRLTGTPSAG